jgi:hypothetical protein
MEIGTAFGLMQTEVNAHPAQLTEARERRDLIREAFVDEDDVDQLFPSGSLARGTMLAPIHDVDYVVVFNGDCHREWGQPGESAGEALSYVSSRVNDLLGVSNGSVRRAVRLAAPRNHAVKCFLDDPGDDLPFTVDVVPALEQSDGTLLIPESESKRWIQADPKDLMRRIAARHEKWNRFVHTVRLIKHWNANVAKAGLKSLAIEVLAYQCIPDVYTTGDKELRPDALMRFFTAAVVGIEEPICDPAGICGEIQPDLDVELAVTKLQEASDGAYLAVAAEQRGDLDAAICQWRKIMGPVVPEPSNGCQESAGGRWGASLVLPRPVRDTPQGIE